MKIFLFFACLSFTLFAQEIELSTNNVQVYARVKNCVDFYLCSPYEETLKIDKGHYRWKAQFKIGIQKLQKAFSECSVDNLKFDITVRDENGVAQKDFLISRAPLASEVHRYLLPMELYSRTYEGLKAKHNSVELLLQNKDPLTAMKSTSFEMEYPLGDYHLEAAPLPPNVLGQTHHLKKLVTYDLDKWDGSVCRFYEVMRHETQHVRNRRKQIACKNHHHFRKSNHDERSTYLNDLVFIKTYCPENVALYQNVESILLKMYQDKNYQTCGLGGQEGIKGEGQGEGKNEGEEKGGGEGDNKSTSSGSSSGSGLRSGSAEKILKDYLKNPHKYKVYRYRYKGSGKGGNGYVSPRPSNPSGLH